MKRLFKRLQFVGLALVAGMILVPLLILTIVAMQSSQSAAESLCTFEANTSSLKIPWNWIESSVDSPEKLIQLKPIGLDGVVHLERSETREFHIWYLAKPHPESGLWRFRSLMLNKKYFLELGSQHEVASVQRTILDPSGNAYFMTFDFRDGEWTARTNLDSNFKPTRDSKGPGTLLEWYFEFPLGNRHDPMPFPSCNGFLRPGESAPYQGTCGTDMEISGFSVKVLFDWGLRFNRSEILDIAEAATQSFLAASFPPGATAIAPN